MTEHGMPFLMINLGVEMIFVLHSRLRAQSVSAEKSTEVLRDIGSNLFSSAFLTEVFTPQPLYTPSSVLQVFASLSNSSVMHLSDNSMKKLYDLVFMTVKYQVFTLRHPLELYELTLNHLDAMVALLPASVHPMVTEARELLMVRANFFTLDDWAATRRALLNFFGGRHVRVSVFLDNKVQDATTGAFYIPKDTYLSPSPACQPPGRVMTADGTQSATFPHPDAALPYPPAIPFGSWNPLNPATRMTRNGFDMYASSSSSHAAAGAPGAGFADPLGKQTRELPQQRPNDQQRRAATGSSSSGGGSGGPVVPISAETLSQAEVQRAYDAELNYLAKIVGGGGVGGARASGVQTFELELFDEPTNAGSSNSGGGVTGGVTPVTPTAAATTVSASAAPVVVPVARMTPSAMQEQNKKLLGILHDLDGPQRSRASGSHGASQGTASAAAAKGSGGNDLLDIMDEL